MKKAFCKQFDRSHESRRESMQVRHEQNIPTRSKIIRDNCMDCTGGSPAAIKSCGIVKCRMWPYRFGRNPKASDLEVPVTDDSGNIVGYREYRTYPVETSGGGKAK